MDFDLLASKITPDVVFDIGCFKGHWHNEARLRWPNAHFILIDANPANLDAIQATGAEHYIAVLADSKKEATFFTRKDDPSGCTGDSLYREMTPWYSDENVVQTKVQTTTLDALISERATKGLPLLKGVVLAKIDAQGAELDILKGAEFALGMTEAVVLEVALGDYNDGAPKAGEVHDHLYQDGFLLDGALGTITHPLTGVVIQEDRLYVR